MNSWLQMNYRCMEKWLYWLEDNSDTIWINWSTGKKCWWRQSRYLTNEQRNVEARKGEMCVENNGLVNGISYWVLLFYDLLITIRCYLASNRQSSLAEVHPKVQPLTLSNTTFDEKGIPLIYLPLKNWCPFLIPSNSKSFFNNHNM